MDIPAFQVNEVSAMGLGHPSILMIMIVHGCKLINVTLYSSNKLSWGLETPPRTSTSHLASDPKCRPPSAQPRTKLSMATCPGQRTMEATRGNGYAPAWGSLVMMMMNKLSADKTDTCHLTQQTCAHVCIPTPVNCIPSSLDTRSLVELCMRLTAS